MNKYCRIILLLACAIMPVLQTGCPQPKRVNSQLLNLALHIEYLVRGDLASAGEMIKGVTGTRYLKGYTIFMPRFVSIDDETPRYPAFLENRKNRYPTIQELKREGIIGEGTDGMLAFVKDMNDPSAKAEAGLFSTLIQHENFDRNQLAGLVNQASPGISVKQMQAASAAARRELALHSEYVQVNKNGENSWIQVNKSTD